MTQLLAAERGHAETTTATTRLDLRAAREALAMRAFAARAMRAVQASPCTIHGARTGQPAAASPARTTSDPRRPHAPPAMPGPTLPTPTAVRQAARHGPRGISAILMPGSANDLG